MGSRVRALRVTGGGGGLFSPLYGVAVLCDWLFYCKIISTNDKKRIVFEVFYSGWF